jgi:hypothetical protein
VKDGDIVSIGPLQLEWWRDMAGFGLDRGEHHRTTARERLARSGRLGTREVDDDDEE